MSKVTMPDPVAYAIFSENGNIRIWSRVPRDLPDLDSLGPMHQLITTAQAEAYAAAKVREVLEEAAIVVEKNALACTPTTAVILLSQAQAIRALIQKEAKS